MVALTSSFDARSIHRPSIGRFAPSPSGPLHFGSLIAAVASYCDARSIDGQWLLRMEDIDPPREQSGAADCILRSLENHGLIWDGSVLYQSQRQEAYADALSELEKRGLLFPCYCSRKAIAAAGGVYPGTCRNAAPQTKPSALRVRIDTVNHPIQFKDIFFGQQSCDLAQEVGDFIVRRKDKLIAYQLAVVIDDIYQQISHVIRGSDLLSSTAQQIYLFELFANKSPIFGHIPVANNRAGQKLSKQHHAKPLDDAQASHNLWRALNFLRQQPEQELQTETPATIMEWACKHWDRHKIPATMGIDIDPDNNA